MALFEAQAMLGNPSVPGGHVGVPASSWVIVVVDVTLHQTHLR